MRERDDDDDDEDEENNVHDYGCGKIVETYRRRVSRQREREGGPVS